MFFSQFLTKKIMYGQTNLTDQINFDQINLLYIINGEANDGL